jgi:hypothetical protein
MPDQITTAAARRIAKSHNECGGNLSGGFLAFDRNGHGGEWYSKGSRPNVAILFPVGNRRVTAREVKDWHDDMTAATEFSARLELSGQGLDF